MKLLMESWRKFLKEGISDVVYHATSNIAAAANIEIETVIAYSAELTPPFSRVIHKGKKKDSIAKLNIVFARS